MAEITPPEKLNLVDKNIIRSQLRASFKYIHFGKKLFLAREKKGIRSHELAGFLEIPPEVYSKYESGSILPEKNIMIKLSRILDVEMGRLMQWAKFASMNAQKFFEDNIPATGAVKYAKDWQNACNEFLENYSESLLDGIKPGEDIIKILKGLERDVLRLFRLPATPYQTFLILSELRSNPQWTGSLSSVQDFILKGEGFQNYVARDSNFGSFICYAANLLYFHDSPSFDIIACFNRLNFEQFRTLFLIAVARIGIHINSQDLVFMQEYQEFSSLGALMVAKLKPYLPKEIKFEELYAATLMQGIGTYAFYTVLKTKLLQGSDDAVVTDQTPNINDILNDQVLRMLNYHLHPVIAGMIAANRGYPESIVRCIINHHVQPIENVSVLCAWLKLINFFVDADFPAIKQSEMNDLLKRYPQVKISEESLFKVSREMVQLKSHMIEASSSIVNEASKTLSKVVSKRGQKNKLYQSDNVAAMLEAPAKASDCRFEPEYQEAVVPEAGEHLVWFTNDFHFRRRKDETVEDIANRSVALHIAFEYVIHGNIETVAEHFKISVDQVKYYLSKLPR